MLAFFLSFLLLTQEILWKTQTFCFRSLSLYISYFVVFANENRNIFICFNLENKMGITWQNVLAKWLTFKFVDLQFYERWSSYLLIHTHLLPFKSLRDCVYLHQASITITWWYEVKYLRHVYVLFVLRFYGPVNPMGSCRARSVYLTTRLLGRLSPLSG